MNLRRIIIHAYLYIPYCFHKITGTGAFGRHKAAYIHGPIQNDGNPLKAALLKHHVKQFHESSCSVASVVSVVNAIRSVQVDRPVPISQLDILEKVRTTNWKERMTANGYKGRRGIPLPLLGEIVKSSLDAYEIQYKAVATVPAPKNTDQSEKIRKILWQRLHDFEKRGDCLIIAHFDQGVYVPTLNIPHISPVGGFDTTNGDVIVLDVDPQQGKPYKISFDRFYKGLSSNYHHVFRPFGFGSGGYVYVFVENIKCRK
jgi:hypothetical protein